MKRDAKQVNTRGVVLALGGGTALMLVAAQLVAKPNGTPSAGNAARPATRQAETATVTTRVVSSPLATSPLVGSAPIRELFRPLVTPQKAAPKTPLTPTAPKLPAAPPVKPVAAAPAVPTAVAPSAPATPSGSSVGEIQMLGVVEFSDGVKALLKKTSSGESRYFAKGEDAFGFTVGDITATEVSLAHAGKTDKVAMSTATPIETNAGTSFASSSFNSGGSSSGFGNGGSFRERGSRGGNSFGGGDRSSRGVGDTTSRSDSGFSTSQIMSLPTWTERLKKLEEIKATIEPEKYERLKKFMESRAAAEKGK